MGKIQTIGTGMMPLSYRDGLIPGSLSCSTAMTINHEDLVPGEVVVFSSGKLICGDVRPSCQRMCLSGECMCLVRICYHCQ